MSESTIAVVVTYTLKPGHGEAFARDLHESGVLEKVRREAGCMQYELFSAVDTPDRMLLAEQWDGKANMDAHAAGDLFKLMQSIEGKHVSGVDVKRF